MTVPVRRSAHLDPVKVGVWLGVLVGCIAFWTLLLWLV